MDRSESLEEDTRGQPGPAEDESTDEVTREIQPTSWRDVTDFVDEFDDDSVYAVVAHPDDGASGVWIVRDIEKLRPSAVPVYQPPTFEMNVLGTGGNVISNLRLTIDELEEIRVANTGAASATGDD